MTDRWRQAVMVSCGLALGVTWALAASVQARSRVVDAGLWFDEGVFQGSKLGAPLTGSERAVIVETAFEEVRAAFAGLRIAITERRDSRFSVQVAQTVRDLRFRRRLEVAGASRGMAGFGGRGAVNFNMAAALALGYAPPEATREQVVQAIGRAVGRAAVHELAHMLLPKAPLDIDDPSSYEHFAAQRREQAYGTLRWTSAWPLLRQRLGEEATHTDPPMSPQP